MLQRLVLLALAVSIVSCGGRSDPLTRIEATYAGTVDAVCRACPAAAGAATEAECRMSATEGNPFSGPEWECQRNAYNRFPNELGPTYDCMGRAVSGFDTCLRNATRTCPPATADVTACSDALNAATDACPLPDSAMALEALSACFSGP